MPYAATPDAPPEPRRRTVTEIVRAVAHVAETTPERLLGASKNQRMVTLRWAAMRIARDQGHSMPHIGRWMGHRDHTTVLYGLRSADALLDPERAALLAETEMAARLLLAQTGALPSIPVVVRTRPAPATAVAPEPETVDTIRAGEVARAKLLYQRGWSLPGIARYLGRPVAVVAAALGDVERAVLEMRRARAAQAVAQQQAGGTRA